MTGKEIDLLTEHTIAEVVISTRGPEWLYEKGFQSPDLRMVVRHIPFLEKASGGCGHRVGVKPRTLLGSSFMCPRCDHTSKTKGKEVIKEALLLTTPDEIHESITVEGWDRDFIVRWGPRVVVIDYMHSGDYEPNHTELLPKSKMRIEGASSSDGKVRLPKEVTGVVTTCEYYWLRYHHFPYLAEQIKAIRDEGNSPLNVDH
jgi:hypothetical protein